MIDSKAGVLLTESDAAKVLGVRPQTLASWRSSGKYNLRFLKVGRKVRYRQIDIDQWLLSRIVGANDPQGIDRKGTDRTEA